MCARVFEIRVLCSVVPCVSVFVWLDVFVLVSSCTCISTCRWHTGEYTFLIFSSTKHLLLCVYSVYLSLHRPNNPSLQSVTALQAWQTSKTLQNCKETIHLVTSFCVSLNNVGSYMQIREASNAVKTTWVKSWHNSLAEQFWEHNSWWST